MYLSIHSHVLLLFGHVIFCITCSTYYNGVQGASHRSSIYVHSRNMVDQLGRVFRIQQGCSGESHDSGNVNVHKTKRDVAENQVVLTR